MLGIGPDFDIYGFQRWQRITDLVTAAQDAGVFGIPDHAVAVLHLAGDHGFVDAHRVALTTPQCVVLCTEPIDTADLLTDRLCGIDAAVHLLTAVAGHATRLLEQARPLAATGAPAARTGRAFPSLRIDRDAAPRKPFAHLSSAAATRRRRA
jgi:hypothetical protein